MRSQFEAVAEQSLLLIFFNCRCVSVENHELCDNIIAIF